MAILIGVVALAVLPNIQRSRESKDIQALDSIASAANAAIATTQAKGKGTFDIGTTAKGVGDGVGSLSGEQKAIADAIFNTVAAGAGKTESTAASAKASIVLNYDVSSKKVEVAYADTGKIADANCAKAEYLEKDNAKQIFKVSNSVS